MQPTQKTHPRCLCAILATLLLFVVSDASARPGLRLLLPEGPAPLTLEGVPSIKMPPLDMAVVAAEDAALAESRAPMRFAVPHAVLITPHAYGVWEAMPGDPDIRIWRLRIQSPGARSLNLGFDRFVLPEGARLQVYASDLTHTLRAFTADDNKDHGELWTPVVLSDDIVVELQVPLADATAVDLMLTSVNHGYRVFAKPGAAPTKSGSCNVDTICPEADGWRNQVRSVARIVISGAFLCTGSLLNNTAQDLKPYFLTADHCGVDTGNDQTVVVYWNYQNSTCRTPGSPQSGGAGNGSLFQNQSGTILRAANAASDFSLLELEDAPDPAWNVYWNGWDRRNLNPASAVAIHHPSGDEKRISFENDPLTTTSFGGNASPGDGTNLRVADWDLGTTEGGSSGSPLYSPGKRVIGQLQGGFAACGNNQPDWYGRLSVSWDRGSTQATRLREWLDPLNMGVTLLDGTATAAPSTPAAPSALEALPLSTSEIQLSWKDNSNNESDFVVEISEEGGAFTLLSSAPANSIGAVAQDLEAGKTYAFRVQARNGAGNSAFSNIAEATTALAAPESPSDLTATALSSAEIRLNWSDNSDNEDNFLVEFSTNGSTFVPLLTLSENAQLATVGNLQPLTRYFFRVSARNNSGTSAPSNVADTFTFGADGQNCVPSTTTLCLSEGRFQVRAEWRTPQGDSGVGQAQILTGDTGYFWFFNEANVEMVIKVLDACSFADRFWVFAGGLTNVEVDIMVVDSLTGAVKTYSNPQSTAFQPIQDTGAFATCP